MELGFKVQGPVFGIHGLGLGFKVQSLEFRV
jgi:hypothetical protein